MTFDWLVSAKSLCFGNAETILRWDEIDRVPSESRSAAILACEIEIRRPLACLDAFSAGQLDVRGVLVKVPKLALARKLVTPERENFRSRIFGVLCDYYTCHVPVSEPGAGAVFRYCLGLRQGGGMKARVKRVVKIMLAEFGFGAVLCDYFLVFIERRNNGY